LPAERAVEGALSGFIPNQLFNFLAPPAGGYQPRLLGQGRKPTEAEFIKDMAALLADMRAALGPERCGELWKEAAKRPPGPAPGTTRKFPEADKKMLGAYDAIRAGAMTVDDPDDKNLPLEVLARKLAEFVFKRWGSARAGASVPAITKRLTRLINEREKRDKAARQAQAQALPAPRRNALMGPPGTD
jgi:hypothetical protein